MLQKPATLQTSGLGQHAHTNAMTDIGELDRVQRNAEGMEHGLVRTPVVNVSPLAKLFGACTT